MRKKIFFTGTILVVMLLLSTTPALANSLQLSPDEVQTITTEVKSGKPIKDILSEHQLTFGQIRSVLEEAGFKGRKHKLSNTQIIAIATKLGLDVNQIQAEVTNGKTLQQILIDNNITEAQIKEVIKGEMKDRLDDAIPKKHVRKRLNKNTR